MLDRTDSAHVILHYNELWSLDMSSHTYLPTHQVNSKGLLGLSSLPGDLVPFKSLNLLSLFRLACH